jgi:hypothetical protein
LEALLLKRDIFFPTSDLSWAQTILKLLKFPIRIATNWRINSKKLSFSLNDIDVLKGTGLE